ncbi:hypothetical protein DPQ25_06565 [Hydrogeniiclostridium mannosilyticum]|uniref:Uncharacterized protein n=1 Tax=Hydrogeniiclostridium mannosilyticum TaxID=2764322 RepID=A0A328UFF5_9FIRM|nr:hypothetical protein [Hydrogeniiclostridium mannosilyticum]RAQ29150.1 hypothetical protein DPQ25_06565 [Hydrogeniiclostridium mannosilyticum]
MIRSWSNQQADSGSVHCFGNGNFLIYAQGPNLSQVEGPPYSMPSFCSLAIGCKSAQAVMSESQREKGANIWTHRISGEVQAQFTDYMLPDKNLFFRDYSVSAPLTLTVHEGPETAKRVYRDFAFGGMRRDCLMIRMPMGTNFFTSIAVEQETWLILTVEGGAVTEEGHLLLENSGRLLLSAGLLPDAVSQMEEALGLKPAQAQGLVRHYWKDFLSGITDLGASLPADEVPEKLRERVSQACESVAVVIKCQQSSSGGEQAGYPYPLAYVRDMAGTMRGMLSLGMQEEARKILEFWYSRFCLFGNVHNAEGMGNFGGRLYFPNDEVEVPAYLIVSAFWYADKTGDWGLLDEIYPMLKWAFEIQLPQLGGGMTSFSGDETYIAGGTLPRVLMYDGSAESTLLFIEGGLRFLDWCRTNKKISAAELERYEKMVVDAKARYKENFCVDGLLYANNPARLNYIKKPAFARGFCEVHDTLQHQLVLGWLMYDEKSGYYCCPECYGKKHPDPVDRKKRHQLSSASLLPAFYESTIFAAGELERIASPYIELFAKNGFVPSNAEGNRSLGYDYGLFLYAMSMLKHSLRVPALAAMLEVLDETGAWVEYYDNKKPFNCRCRPWESAINIDAIRKLTESFQ